MEAPQNPAGEFVEETDYSHERREHFIRIIEDAPAKLRAAVHGLTASQLDTKFRNWTIRQIVHHIADSHVNSFVRFKWALTEDNPTIKDYDEARWVELADERSGDIEPPLAMLDGLHKRWVQMLRSMTDAQYRRTFFHPQSKNTSTLSNVLAYYAWHCQHHTAQITWLKRV